MEFESGSLNPVVASRDGDGEESIWSTASRTKKYIATAAIYYCTFAFGVGGGITIMGPALVDFSNKFDKSVDETSTIFSISTGGYLTGALAIGVLTKFISRQFLVMFLLCIGSAVMFIIPHVTSIQVFFSLGMFMGIYGGGYDTAQVAWIIDVWRHESPPYILTRDFMYSLGAIVPPLMLSPFLKGEDETTTATAPTTTPTMGGNSNSTLSYEEDAKLWIPFSIAGGVVAFGVIVQIALYFVFYGTRGTSTKSGKSGKENSPSAIDRATSPPIIVPGAYVVTYVGNNNYQYEPPKSSLRSKFKLPEARELILIILSCSCISFYLSMDICTQQFLPVFAQFSKVDFTEAGSADLLFSLTVAYCVGRAIGIFVVLRAPPHYILLGNFILQIAANLILLFAGDSSTDTLMWVGSILMGFAFSTTFPAYFAYLEKYLFISDAVVSVILVTSGVVSAIYPVIIGRYVEEYPKVLIYVNLFSIVLLISSFGATFWLTYFKAKREKRAGETHVSGVDNNYMEKLN